MHLSSVKLHTTHIIYELAKVFANKLVGKHDYCRPNHSPLLETATTFLQTLTLFKNKS